MLPTIEIILRRSIVLDHPRWSWEQVVAAVRAALQGRGDRALPGEQLALMKGTTGFTWSQPVSGGGAVYDLLRSNNAGDFWNATCVASGVPPTSVPAAWDTDPRPGEIVFYLVRARSDCGTARMGSKSDGTPRQGTACK